LACEPIPLNVSIILKVIVIPPIDILAGKAFVHN
jgi:hypothetical protein